MTRDSNRLIMELDMQRREVNREMINPIMATAEIATLLPVVNVCAKARAAYIKCLMEIATDDSDESCSFDQIEQLKQYRIAYEELIGAANALETVIKRDYVDVKG
ncbi:MAG: hypothetical protein AB8B79_06800 [Granulosicoccus sp.]